MSDSQDTKQSQHRYKPPCKFGSSCGFLQNGSCRYYHTAQQIKDAPSLKKSYEQRKQLKYQHEVAEERREGKSVQDV